jgi:hypothetical protein
MLKIKTKKTTAKKTKEIAEISPTELDKIQRRNELDMLKNKIMKGTLYCILPENFSSDYRMNDKIFKQQQGDL